MAKNLKAVPAENKGLSKLPENVRNRMGYMKKGSKVSKAKIKSKPNTTLKQLEAERTQTDPDVYKGLGIFFPKK